MMMLIRCAVLDPDCFASVTHGFVDIFGKNDEIKHQLTGFALKVYHQRSLKWLWLIARHT